MQVGEGLDVDNTPDAVPWRDVAAIAPDGNRVTVKLDRQQLAQAPRFGLKAQQRPQEPTAQQTFEHPEKIER